MSRRLVTLIVDVDSNLDAADLYDLLRFHLGLGSLDTSDLDLSGATILGGRATGETPMPERTWCRRCGVAYEDHLPTCECAGEPPADYTESVAARMSRDGRAYTDRVRRLEWIDGVSR